MLLSATLGAGAVIHGCRHQRAVTGVALADGSPVSLGRLELQAAPIRPAMRWPPIVHCSTRIRRPSDQQTRVTFSSTWGPIWSTWRSSLVLSTEEHTCTSWDIEVRLGLQRRWRGRYRSVVDNLEINRALRRQADGKGASRQRAHKNRPRYFTINVGPSTRCRSHRRLRLRLTCSFRRGVRFAWSMAGSDGHTSWGVEGRRRSSR